MAWIERRPPLKKDPQTGKTVKARHKDGSVSWRVIWRDPETGKVAADTREIFSTNDHDSPLEVAKAFKGLVEHTGNRRPAGFPPKCAPNVRLDEQDKPYLDVLPAEPAPSHLGRTWNVVYDEYAAVKRKAQPKHRARKEQQWRDMFAEQALTLPDRTKTGTLGLSGPEDFTDVHAAIWASWLINEATFPKCKGRCKQFPDCKCPEMSYSPKSVGNIYRQSVKPVFDYAFRRGYITDDPFREVEWPLVPEKTVNLEQVPLGEELDDWIRSAYKVNKVRAEDPMLAGDMTLLAIYTGARWGEFSALRWFDVDEVNCTVTINQAVKEDENYQLYIVSYGKSHRARRTISVPPEVIAMLRRRAAGRKPKDLLFPAARGGPMRNSYFREHHWTKVLKEVRKVGVETEATVHKLRHAHVTTLRRGGMDLETVAARLGQHPSVTAAVYRHVSAEDDAAASDIMLTAMNRKSHLYVAEIAS